MHNKIKIYIALLGLVGMTSFVILHHEEPVIKKVKQIYEFNESFTKKDIIENDFLHDYQIVKADKKLLNHLKDKKNSLPIGTYQFVVKDHEKEVQYEIKIQDTTKPEFTKTTDSISIDTTVTSIDWNEYFEGKDASPFTMEVQNENLVYQKPGTYSVLILLKDKYKNTASFETQVKINPVEEQVIEKDDPDQPAPAETVPPSSNEPTVISPTYVDGILVVNKVHPIPGDFASQEDPEAGAQIRKLIQDMQGQGFNISSNYSGYRSHQYQTNLYNQYVISHGKEAADTFSARPGYSEHETGLSFDLINGYGALVETDPEAEWIRTHAHEYGFIVRYPYGKEDITGFMPEPWHLRYIGSKAYDIYHSGLCLEEYLQVSGGKYYQ